VHRVLIIKANEMHYFSNLLIEINLRNSASCSYTKSHRDALILKFVYRNKFEK